MSSFDFLDDDFNIDNKKPKADPEKVKEFKEKIEEAKKKYGVETDKELREHLPKRHGFYGSSEVVTMSGLALSSSGKLTRSDFFKNMDLSRKDYEEIVLTPSEARSISIYMKNMSTGINVSVPMMCSTSCPFRDVCPYVAINKEPIGRKCPVENELLMYHTEKFFEEFDVDISDYSEVMLVQELSELIIYEMRVSNVLAKPENANLNGINTKFSKDGDIVEEEVIHWAWKLKDSIKNRRMKILESLNATRKSKKGTTDDSETRDYFDTIKAMKDMIKNAKAKEVKVEEVKD